MSLDVETEDVRLLKTWTPLWWDPDENLRCLGCGKETHRPLMGNQMCAWCAGELEPVIATAPLHVFRNSEHADGPSQLDVSEEYRPTPEMEFSQVKADAMAKLRKAGIR